LARVLVIDDDPGILSVLRLYLEQHGHECLAARVAAEGLKIIREEAPDIVITDVMMPGMTGGAVYEVVRKEFGPKLPIIVSTGTSLRFSPEDDSLAAFYPKQDDYAELMGLVETLLNRADCPPV
jgi:twitching motility two-component system response regulator PilH